MSDDDIVDPTRPEDASLEDVAADFICRREGGENPSLDAYMARYPRYAEDLARLLAFDATPPTRALDRTERMDEDAVVGRRAASDDGPLRIGPYEVLAHVSTAGGGTVYRARDVRSDVVVALKTLDGRGSVDPRDLERFRREAKVVQALDLVGVVPVLDAGIDGGRHWIAMKWIEGATLRELRSRVGDKTHTLHDLRDRARLVARIARTFSEIHRVNVLHRDVKPSNIMTDRTGEPMVIDFGIARAENLPELTATSDGAMGTPRYLAPEIILRGNAAGTPRTDVYGLGLCLYEIATLVEPFAGCSREKLFQEIAAEGPAPPRKVAPTLPFDLEAITLRAIEIDPARRYGSMAEFADDLERFARGEPPDRRTLARAKPLARLWARKRRPMALAALGFVACVALFATYWTKSVAPERRARALEAALLPYAWLPPDALADGVALDDATIEDLTQAVREAPGDGDDRRALAAWMHYVKGRRDACVATLGPRRPGETFGPRLLRAVVQAQIEEAEAATVAPMPDGPSSVDAREVVLEERRLDAPLSQKTFDAVYAAEATVGAPARPVDRAIGAALQWSALPTAKGGDRTFGKSRAETLLDGRDDAPARYLRAAFAALEERFAEALPELDVVLTKAPSATGARFLRGIARLRTGAAAAAFDDLSAVRGTLPETHRAWPTATGWTALAARALGRKKEAADLLDAWATSRTWTRWQDGALPRAALGDLLVAEGAFAEAAGAYEAAIAAEPRWAPAYDRAIDACRRSGRAAKVEDLAARRAKLLDAQGRSVAIPVPADVDAFLSAFLFGLRVPDRVVGSLAVHETGGDDR